MTAAVLTRSDSSTCVNSLIESLAKMCWQTGDTRLETITKQVGDQTRRVGCRTVRYEGAVLTHKNALEIVEQLRQCSDNIPNGSEQLQGTRADKVAALERLFRGAATRRMCERIVDTLRPEVTEVTVLRARGDQHFSLFVDFC